MASTQAKRQKVSTAGGGGGGGAVSGPAANASSDLQDQSVKVETLLAEEADDAGRRRPPRRHTTITATLTTTTKKVTTNKLNNGRHIDHDHHNDDDDDQDDDDQDDDEEEEEEGDDDDETEEDERLPNGRSIQQQLAASGPAGVAAAAAIATARKRRRPHAFETNPSVRKRQQTRLIRKLRACIDEYTARVGQQAIVLITTPGRPANNFKVFGAQPLESVIRACKEEIMAELEQAVLEQTPNLRLTKEGRLVPMGGGGGGGGGQHSNRDADHEVDGQAANRHELPPLVIEGIPTPVEKMTQAQLRAFIPLMLKYSTGRGKPGWGKDSTRPPWWPTTLPWANVRSDARDEDEKQRISWTTTLREIVTNCYKYHGREDLLPVFDETTASGGDEQPSTLSSSSNAIKQGAKQQAGGHHKSSHRTANGHHSMSQRPLGSASTRSSAHRMAAAAAANHQHLLQNHHHHHHQLIATSDQIYTTASGYITSSAGPSGGGGADGGQGGNFMHTTIANPDGTVSLVQVDPANAQILTLPDGTQVRAVRLQTLSSGEQAMFEGGAHHQHHQQQLIGGHLDESGHQIDHQQGQQEQHHHHHHQQHQQADGGGGEGQIILTGEDGTQSCYPMSSLVSIPASVYQQFASAGQPISIVTSDGSLATANVIHTIQEAQEISASEANDAPDETDEAQSEQQQQQQQVLLEQVQVDKLASLQAPAAGKSGPATDTSGHDEDQKDTSIGLELNEAAQTDMNEQKAGGEDQHEQDQHEQDDEETN